MAFDKVLDGTSFATSDGRVIRLSGVLAPGDDGENVLAGEAESARRNLADLLRSGPIAHSAEPNTVDRYGRVLAQVFANGVWIQGAMLRKGELRASPDFASASCAKLLLEAENAARTDRTGLWKSRKFSVFVPDQITSRAGTFQIVEGAVQTASVTRGRAYINFGADYRSDFTVTVSPEDMKLFRQSRFNVRTLAGKRIRVRGWVELYNGPEMEIATPAAIEILP